MANMSSTEMRDHIEFLCFGINGSVQQMSSENITTRFENKSNEKPTNRATKKTLVAIRAYKDRKASPEVPHFKDRE